MFAGEDSGISSLVDLEIGLLHELVRESTQPTRDVFVQSTNLSMHLARRLQQMVSRYCLSTDTMVVVQFLFTLWRYVIWYRL